MSSFKTEFVWTIEGIELDKFKRSLFGQHIDSPTITIPYSYNAGRVRDQMSFFMRCFPCAPLHLPKGYTYIYLHLVDLSEDISHLSVLWKSGCSSIKPAYQKEYRNFFDLSKKKGHWQHAWSPENAVSFELFKKLKKVQFKLNIEVLRVFDKSGKTIPDIRQLQISAGEQQQQLSNWNVEFEWNINNNNQERMLNKFRNSAHGQVMCSPTVSIPLTDKLHSCDDRISFRMRLFPNAPRHLEVGYTYIYLELLDVPDDVSHISARFQIYCECIDPQYSCDYRNTFDLTKKKGHYEHAWSPVKAVALKDFKGLSNVSFRLCIQLLRIYDKNSKLLNHRFGGIGNNDCAAIFDNFKPFGVKPPTYQEHNNNIKMTAANKEFERWLCNAIPSGNKYLTKFREEEMNDIRYVDVLDTHTLTNVIKMRPVDCKKLMQKVDDFKRHFAKFKNWLIGLNMYEKYYTIFEQLGINTFTSFHFRFPNVNAFTSCIGSLQEQADNDCRLMWNSISKNSAPKISSPTNSFPERQSSEGNMVTGGGSVNNYVYE